MGTRITMTYQWRERPSFGRLRNRVLNWLGVLLHTVAVSKTEYSLCLTQGTWLYPKNSALLGSHKSPLPYYFHTFQLKDERVESTNCMDSRHCNWMKPLKR